MKGKELWILLLAAAMLSGAMGSGVLALEEESPAELDPCSDRRGSPGGSGIG